MSEAAAAEHGVSREVGETRSRARVVPSGTGNSAGAMVASAARLRWRAPELALLLADRASAAAARGGQEAVRLRAEVLAVFACNQLGRGASAGGRAVRALRAAQAAGESVTERLVRVELAACAADASAPAVALGLLQPVLSATRRRMAPTARAAAMVTAADGLARLGGGPEVAGLLAAADRLYDASRAVEPDAVALRRGVVKARLAAHHRRIGDHSAAQAAVRDGLALLDDLSDGELETGQVRGSLTVELVLSLLDTGREAEAMLTAQPVLRRPVRPAGAPSACWLRLAMSSRVHLPSGRHPLARRLLGDAVFIAERHHLDVVLAECLHHQAQLQETCAELADAVWSLRAAHFAERRWRDNAGELRTLLAAEFGAPPPAADLRAQLAAAVAETLRPAPVGGDAQPPASRVSAGWPGQAKRATAGRTGAERTDGADPGGRVAASAVNGVSVDRSSVAAPASEPAANHVRPATWPAMPAEQTGSSEQGAAVGHRGPAGPPAAERPVRLAVPLPPVSPPPVPIPPVSRVPQPEPATPSPKVTETPTPATPAATVPRVPAGPPQSPESRPAVPSSAQPPTAPPSASTAAGPAAEPAQAASTPAEPFRPVREPEPVVDTARPAPMPEPARSATSAGQEPAAESSAEQPPAESATEPVAGSSTPAEAPAPPESLDSRLPKLRLAEWDPDREHGRHRSDAALADLLAEAMVAYQNGRRSRLAAAADAQTRPTEPEPAVPPAPPSQPPPSLQPPPPSLQPPSPAFELPPLPPMGPITEPTGFPALPRLDELVLPQLTPTAPPAPPPMSLASGGWQPDPDPSVTQPTPVVTDHAQPANPPASPPPRPARLVDLTPDQVWREPGTF